MRRPFLAGSIQVEPSITKLLAVRLSGPHARHIGTVTGPLSGLATVVDDPVGVPRGCPCRAANAHVAVRDVSAGKETPGLGPPSRVQAHRERLPYGLSPVGAIQHLELQRDGT